MVDHVIDWVDQRPLIDAFGGVRARQVFLFLGDALSAVLAKLGGGTSESCLSSYKWEGCSLC